jgi:hypothetical protein
MLDRCRDAQEWHLSARRLLAGEGGALPRSRQLWLTVASLASSLALALVYPTASEKMFAGQNTGRCAALWASQESLLPKGRLTQRLSVLGQLGSAAGTWLGEAVRLNAQASCLAPAAVQ